MSPSQDEPRSQRVGVVDIGSNSIRLVAFDVRRGLPLYLFNEKALGRLGQGLATTGHLSAQAIDLALDSLTRFAKLSEALQLDSLFLLATAAVRDATDGPDFVTRVEEIFGTQVAVLSGEEEARLSALGVLSGLPGATGIAADLGGGSLELAELQDDQIGQCVSLPLGPLRLVELADGNLAGARAEIDRQLDQIAWLKQLEGRTVYLVGGAWRALAHMHMARTDYDLRIVHGYTLRAAEVASFAAKVAKASPAALARMPGAARAAARYIAVCRPGSAPADRPRRAAPRLFFRLRPARGPGSRLAPAAKSSRGSVDCRSQLDRYEEPALPGIPSAADGVDEPSLSS